MQTIKSSDVFLFVCFDHAVVWLSNKRLYVLDAQRNVYFEITYAGVIADVQTRRQIITNAKVSFALKKIGM